MYEFNIRIRYDEILDMLKASISGARVIVEAKTFEELFKRVTIVLVDSCREKKLENVEK